MKTILACLLALLLSISHLLAQKSEPVSINLNNYKHPQQYFLDHYGTDDSSKALIKYFFKIRKASTIETVIGAFLAGGLISAFLSTNATFVAVLYAPVIFADALLIIDGPVAQLVYTRKKLLHLLTDYQSGKHLPKKLIKKWRFKRELNNLNKVNFT
ncbi:hypothetical protein [Mucilaginibacter sp.]|uniref:hypothetical protein n=1 Tax=Mucilaginibacter sp. TaxID=1882438 RepID=UPI003B00C50B